MNTPPRISPNKVLQLQLIYKNYHLLLKNNKERGGGGGGLITFLLLKKGSLIREGGLIEELRNIFFLYSFFFICFSLKTARVQSKEEIARQASPYNSTVYVGNLPPYCTGNI